jgi:outer membrane receptor protein involved in Fe transport
MKGNSMMKRKVLILLAAIACAFVFAVPAMAQTINGNIVGTVTDQQGGAVAGVTVTATNTATGFSRNATSNEEGNYRIAALPSGDYTVTTEKSGFASASVAVSVGSASDSTMDIQLKTGDITEKVTVVAGNDALLDTQTSQIAKTVDQTRILELPGRNSLNGLALLNPGVLPNQNGRPGSGFAVNGNRTRSNNFTIDGANNNDQSLSIPRQGLPPEAIGEFQIITNNFAAEFGRNAGSYVNQITKSGTNDVHGVGFWVWNGNGYDALTTTQERNFRALVAAGTPQAQALRLARSVVVSNIYGGNVGGPIVRNHTFFFVSYDAQDDRTTVGSASRTAVTSVGLARLQALAGNPAAGFAPNTVAFLQSNFNVSNTPTDQGSVTLVLPAGVCVAATANCVIPFNVFNRGASGGIPYGTVFDRFMPKINTRINDKDQLSFRYLIDQSSDPGSPTSLPGQEVGSNVRNQSFTVNDVYAISSTMINEARFTYSRRKINFPENLDFAFTIGGTGGAFTFGNINFPQNRLDNVYEWTDNLSKTTGNHNLKFGYNLLKYQLASFFAPNLDGSVTYGSLLDFLLDRNASFSQFAGDGLTDAVTWEHSMFAQDDWRYNSDLTLNLGLRYEYVTTPYGFFSNAKPDINNFSPSVGFAWNPKNWFDGRGVLRAGFRVSYDQVFQNVLLNNSRNFPRGVNVAFSNITGQHPFNNLPAPPTPAQFVALGGNPLLLPLRLFSPNERVKQPMSVQWSTGVQFQLNNEMVLKLDYIGTKGSNLVREVESNVGFTAASGLGNGQRADPTRGSILIGQGIANSIYHAGQVTLERRFSKIGIGDANLGSLLFNANFTYSSFISEADDVLGGQANRTLPADPRCPECDRGRSGFDQPLRFVASYVWQSPDVFRSSSVLSRLFSGYEITGITTLADGTPFHVLSNNNALGILPGQVSTVEGSQRVSINPGGTFPLVSTPTTPVANAYFIVNAANSGIVGSMGANTLRTGGTIRTDLGLVKNIKTFGETQRLQFRADVFNVFNRRNFTTIPTNSLGNTNNLTNFLNFGLTNISGRSFQFGMRYFF